MYRVAIFAKERLPGNMWYCRWLRSYVTSQLIVGLSPNWVIGPEVHSASNRNEYQKQKNVSGE
jgi:hypothetical protein